MEEVDGGYHREMEEAFEDLRVFDTYLASVKLKGKTPRASYFINKNGRTIYRGDNGRFISKKSTLEILIEQVSKG